jgi:Asp-tRNA(Asn)/Glu-tRNA(Gln) amidotransferase A subunit family amidase
MNQEPALATRRAVLAGGTAMTALGLSGAGHATASSIGAVLDTHDAIGLAGLVRSRKVSPSELLEAAIERTEATNPRFNFMAQKHYDFARAEIARGLPEGPFTGVPWLLKDLAAYIEGLPTEGGSRLNKGQRGQFTTELVERYRRAGMVVFGKTTTPEFGLTGTTESALMGPTRNPWNPERIAGGSSGGAAAAIAAGVIPAAHATDGGGSIRIPASCCGLFGLKPSRGRTPMGPYRTEGWGGMSAHHAITRSVRDSAALLDATQGVEPGSRYSAPSPESSFLSQVGRDPGRLRIAVMRKPFNSAPVDPDCLAVLEQTAKLCESLGHHIEAAAPMLDASALGQASFVLIASSLSADILDRAKSLGIAPGPDMLEPITLAFVEYGKTTTGADFARANNMMQAAAVSVAQFMAKYDVILSPTLASPPLPLGQINLTPGVPFPEWGQRAAMFSPFTQMANFTGQPSMSVPLGMSQDGLPVGMLFTGRYGEEALLYRLAGQLERAAPWSARRPVTG